MSARKPDCYVLRLVSRSAHMLRKPMSVKIEWLPCGCKGATPYCSAASLLPSLTGAPPSRGLRAAILLLSGVARRVIE